jgi:hypothetical protein
VSEPTSNRKGRIHRILCGILSCATVGAFVIVDASCASSGNVGPTVYPVLEINSDPEGADVFACRPDGSLQSLGKTPLRLNYDAPQHPRPERRDGCSGQVTSPAITVDPDHPVEPGGNAWKEWVYRLTKKGHAPLQVTERRSSGHTRRLNYTLEPLPKIPTPPLVDYPAPESVAITPVKIDSNAKKRLPKDAKVAIMAFKEPGGSGAGSLLADTLILKMQLAGFDNVVDRDQVDRVMREQNMMAEEKTQLSDLEVSKRLGEILQADYFVFGAIT